MHRHGRAKPSLGGFCEGLTQPPHQKEQWSAVSTLALMPPPSALVIQSLDGQGGKNRTRPSLLLHKRLRTEPHSNHQKNRRAKTTKTERTRAGGREPINALGYQFLFLGDPPARLLHSPALVGLTPSRAGVIGFGGSFGEFRRTARHPAPAGLWRRGRKRK